MKSTIIACFATLSLALTLSSCQSQQPKQPPTKAQICNRITKQLHINQMQNGAHPGQPLQRASLLDDYKNNGCGDQSAKTKSH